MGGRGFCWFVWLGSWGFMLFHLLQFSLNLPIELQLFANLLNGTTGGAYILLSVSFACIADITKTDQNVRKLRISIAELSIGLGSALVAFLNGYLLKYFDGNLINSLVFIVILQTITVIYCLWFLNDDNQVLTTSVLTGLTKKYKYSFHTYTKYRPKNGTKILWLLVLTYVFNTSRDLGQASVLTLYEKNSPFCWSKDQVSFAQSLQEITFVVGIVLSMIIGRLFPGKGSSDVVIFVGIFFNVVSSVFYGLSGLDYTNSNEDNQTSDTNSILLLTAITSPVILAPAITPLLRAKWVTFCKDDEHGAIFGLPAILSTVGIGVSTFLYQSLYGSLFGNVFFVLSVGLDVFSLVVFSVAVVWVGIERRKCEKLERLEPVE